MNRYARRLSMLIAVLGLFACTVAFVPAAASGASEPQYPTIYVQYTLNCTFTIVDDTGKTVTAIPPGTYEVDVSTPIMFKLVNTQNLAPSDFTGCKGWVQFQLSGPGVNLTTTLTTGCDANDLLPVATFQPNSTYTAVDNNQPTVAHMSFTTLASGSPAPPADPTTVEQATGKPTTSSGSPLGQGVASPLAGTLTGTLSALGKATLTSKGKTVSTLKAGRYAFAITDKDPKASFMIQPSKGASKSLSGVQFVGKRSTNVTLTAGRWLYSSGLGKDSYLLVTG
jgi:hypothetical protein